MAKKQGEKRRRRLYMVRRSEGTRYPFNMQVLVRERIITIEQRDKFMKMLCSADKELDALACSMLNEIIGKQKRDWNEQQIQGISD